MLWSSTLLSSLGSLNKGMEVGRWFVLLTVSIKASSQNCQGNPDAYRAAQLCSRITWIPCLSTPFCQGEWGTVGSGLIPFFCHMLGILKNSLSPQIYTGANLRFRSQSIWPIIMCTGLSLLIRGNTHLILVVSSVMSNTYLNFPFTGGASSSVSRPSVLPPPNMSTCSLAAGRVVRGVVPLPIFWVIFTLKQ